MAGGHCLPRGGFARGASSNSFRSRRGLAISPRKPPAQAGGLWKFFRRCAAAFLLRGARGSFEFNSAAFKGTTVKRSGNPQGLPDLFLSLQGVKTSGLKSMLSPFNAPGPAAFLCGAGGGGKNGANDRRAHIGHPFRRAFWWTFAPCPGIIKNSRRLFFRPFVSVAAQRRETRP